MGKKKNKTGTKKRMQEAAPVLKKPQAARPVRNFPYHWIILGIILVLITIIRLRLVPIPLERDEGEYALIGQSFLNGIMPYQEAYSMKLPGTPLVYAIFMELFGESTKGIHTGLWLMNLLTIVIFFLGFRKLFNTSIALFAAAVYGIMSVSPSVLGFAAHATHFVNLFVALALFYIGRYYERKKLLDVFLVGIMLGLSLLMKQQSLFFILFGGFMIILPVLLDKPFRIKKTLLPALLFGAGAVIPYGILLILVSTSGAFDQFWFWTVDYAGKYAAGAGWKEGSKLLGFFFKDSWSEFALVWILFFGGLLITFFSRLTKKQKWFAISFAVFAFLTACPGLYFRSHYFISFLPALGLLSAIAVNSLGEWFNKSRGSQSYTIVPLVVLALIYILAIGKQKAYYFSTSPEEICLQIYGNNPFNESLPIADYIKSHSKKSDTIAVIGSEPQISFYAGRHAATGYIYTYGMMEIQPYNIKMQEEMIREVEKSKPAFMVFCNVSNSWLMRPESPKLIIEWFNKYADAHYEVVGIVDLLEQTYYKWDAEVKGYSPQSPDYIKVYKRR